MEFIILSNNANDNDREAMAKHQTYMNFLENFNQDFEKDLFMYFGKWFFHDGKIENMYFSEDMKNLTMRISCPNIERVTGKPHCYAGAIWFTCTFEGIVNYQFDVRKIDEYNEPLYSMGTRVLFDQCEINTLTESIEKYSKMYDETFNSIIVKTIPGQRDFSMVFQNVSVTPDEPLAFELMKRDDSFKIPLGI
ncbi:MAG: hypothetical protein Q8880_11250 [Bacteroidota bacterium]|nr:hypothetical protein [Bacteroidota bacterium]